METFCQKEGIDHDICGKVIVALDDEEVPRMQKIHERGKANGISCELISKERLAELEPHSAGIAAIHVPECGIVNYRQVCERLAQRVDEKDSNQVINDAKVTRISKTSDGQIVHSTQGEIETSFIVNCTGLHSDRVTSLGGETPPAKIIPFKGEYYELKEEASHLCRNLIYPVPDPQFPFLGVHFTRMIDNSVECGPNAVLAFGREAYGKLDLNLRDLLESLFYRGFQKMAWKHWKMGLGEMWRSYNKAAFVKALRRLIPEINAEHLKSVPAGNSGSGSNSRRRARRRLSHSGNGPNRECLQRPVSGRHRIPQHRTSTSSKNSRRDSSSVGADAEKAIRIRAKVFENNRSWRGSRRNMGPTSTLSPTPTHPCASGTSRGSARGMIRPSTGKLWLFPVKEWATKSNFHQRCISHAN